MKRLIALSAAGYLLLTGCTGQFEELGIYRESYSSETSEVSISVDEVYEKLIERLENKTNISAYDGYVDADIADAAIHRIKQEHPEIFWISGYTVKNSVKASEIQINVLNDLTAGDLEIMESEIIAAADSIVADMPSGLDDYGKTVYVHDYIVLNTEYDQKGADSDENGLWGTAYGCLVQGRAVCQGYSEAFLCIMNRLGIECGVVTGQTAQGGHAWNYVRLNGMYYWIDVTWDDAGTGGGFNNPIMHTYCLLDDERMMRTRVIDGGQDFVPNCYSMDNNYYVRNGAYVTLYSAEAIGSVLQKNSDVREAEIMFADETAYNTAITELFENSRLWDLTDYADLGDSVDYTKDDNMFVLKISY